MLIAVILFVVITSIVLEAKRKKLADLNDKNEIVKPIEKLEGDIKLCNEKENVIIKIKKHINKKF